MLEDLTDAMAAVLALHNRGCSELAKLQSFKHKQVDMDDMADVVIDVSTEVASYNLLYRVHPVKLDLTKVLTFSAAALAKRDQNYSALPLFYAYIGFLDDTYTGTGMPLRSFGESVFYAENLSSMLAKGQWIAPFCYFRAIDLSFDKCAIPRVEGLMQELADVGGN
jgi:hypothetical protein